MSVSEQQQLAQGLVQMGVVLSAEVQASLLAYLQMMRKWNRVYNLTSRKDMDNMVARHLLDSLSVLPYISGERVIDVGSGAGLPGIPLALAKPECQFVVLDSNAKKGRFRTQAMIELGLKNVTVVTERVERYQPTCGFDFVVSRAFASINDMLAITGHLVAANGKFLAMKGVLPEAELATLIPDYRLISMHDLNVPLLGAERHLAVLAPVHLK